MTAQVQIITKGCPKLPHISVCICTFQRPKLLSRLLDALERQITEGRFTYSIVVSDNDREFSGRPVVAEFAAKSGNAVVYCSETDRNIALARNKALQSATGEYAAFIDDDEFPEADWLLAMLGACERFRSDGVLGPVRPHFDQEPPTWLVKGRFCERPEHRTGRVMAWEECRTGNVLFRRSILEGLAEAFDPQFGTGGEDKDFFMRMTHKGYEFRWCNEGVVHETVPPARWTRTYMLRRAMLRGRNILKHPSGRLRLLAKSVVAIPAYSLALPLALLAGQHVFMRCCIKLSDHAGRVLALVHLNPIRER